jgi:hypothetical protein
MSELQGPRIPGEERSGRRRPLGWIIEGLILPETGGMSPAVLLTVGTALRLMGGTGLSAVVRRPSPSGVRFAL